MISGVFRGPFFLPALQGNGQCARRPDVGRLLDALVVNQVLRRIPVQVVVLGIDELNLQIQPQGTAGAVFDDHQHRQDAVLIRVHLAERRFSLLLGDVGDSRDGDAFLSLVPGIGRRRSRDEAAIVLVRRHRRRYTQKND